jgi:hypothetical protein
MLSWTSNFIRFFFTQLIPCSNDKNVAISQCEKQLFLNSLIMGKLQKCCILPYYQIFCFVINENNQELAQLKCSKYFNTGIYFKFMNFEYCGFMFLCSLSTH